MWQYSQKTGALTDPSGKVIAHGYSGKGIHKNDPTSDHLQGLGPIPRGEWDIIDLKLDTETHGPLVLVLKPRFKTKRSGFLIHGDSLSKPGEASLGCPIFDRKTRETVWNSGDRRFRVVE